VHRYILFFSEPPYGVKLQGLAVELLCCMCNTIGMPFVLIFLPLKGVVLLSFYRCCFDKYLSLLKNKGKKALHEGLQMCDPIFQMK
jgi:hypothetical protein